MKIRSDKIREWLWRYVPAEIVATITALLGATIAHTLTGLLIVAAIGGTIGENIGYYGYFAIKEATRHYRDHSQHGALRRMFLTAVKTVRDMAVEFGPAEALDSLVMRPLCMYLGPQLLPSFELGILAGKIAADIVFYSLAIIGYELRKQWTK